jgi:hypothetical protein
MTTKPDVEPYRSDLQPAHAQRKARGELDAGACRANPFETAESVALATGTSGITVGRFLRKLGYRNLEDAKKAARSLSALGMNERLDSWQQQRPLTAFSIRCRWKWTPLRRCISWRKVTPLTGRSPFNPC